MFRPSASRGRACFESLERRQMLSVSPAATELPAKLAGAADFDANGTPDLLWQNRNTGEVYVELQTGPNVYTKQTVGNVGTSGRWEVVGLTDVDLNASTPDILFFDKQNRRLAYWQVESLVPKRFELVSSPSIAEKWDFRATGNFDGDHDSADYLWQNNQNGRLCIWSMSLGKAFGGFYIIDGTRDLNWKVELAEDFSADGKPDLIWRNIKTGQNSIWSMEWGTGNANVLSVTMLPPVTTTPDAWRIDAAGDFDNNLFFDLLFRNQTTGEITGWSMNGLNKVGEFAVAAGM